jgi:hypothetical protein
LVNRAQAREWFDGSRSLQALYAGIGSTWGRVQVAKGVNLRALDTLLRSWRAVTRLPFRESGIAATREVIRRTCYRKGDLVPVSDNALLAEFLATAEAVRIREAFKAMPRHDAVRLRDPRKGDDPERQGDLILLKRHRPETGEKGVIFLKYGASFLWFAALFDLAAIASRYASCSNRAGPGTRIGGSCSTSART